MAAGNLGSSLSSDNSQVGVVMGVGLGNACVRTQVGVVTFYVVMVDVILVTPVLLP